MKRLGLTGLVILMTYAFGLVAASNAGAVCAVVRTANTGTYTNALCTRLGGTKEYTLVTLLGSLFNELGVLCAKVEEAGTGTFTEENCANIVGGKEWIKILQNLPNCGAAVGLVSICIEKPEGSGELVRENGAYTFSGVLGLETEALLEVPGLELHVVCTKVESTGSFEQTTEIAPVTIDKQTISFNACTVLNPLGEKCKVKEPIEVKESYGEFNEGITEVTLEPEIEGGALTTLTVENVTGKTCGIAGTYLLTGRQTCKPLEAGADAVTHLIECAETGSKELLLTEKEAKLLLVQEVKLTGTEAGKKWSIGKA
ncbi:MAG TPA: hypothetical protein VHT25_10945 [Solirubrobacteraceae bacterium]|jgi:hypothetical protein|nr:hypothetical protein [Solirubrobacteraceae bacterium]